jgi:hypothetical protein
LVEIAHARATRAPSLPSRWQAHPALAASVVGFTGTLIVALIQGPKPFYGDSGGYWSLASSFTHSGHFSLLNFTSPVRGYALPLIYHVVETLGNDIGWSQSSLAKVFNAALFALIGAVLAPQVAENTWPQQRWSVPRRLALTALLVVFWSGDLNYPLSDFPGLALALLTVVAVAHPDKPGWMLTAGVAAGLAIDARPAYLPLAPILVAIVAVTWFDQRGSQHAPWAHRALCMGLLVLGFAAASLPQSLASHRHYKTWSFIPGGPAHLTDEQLTDSLFLQRYDTFVEHQTIARPMVYLDNAGVRLLREKPNIAISSPSEYLEVMVKHPIVIAGLIVRHLINGLDMRYSTVYVENPDGEGHLWLRLAGFALVFLALVRVLWRAARVSLGPARWRYPVALLLCCFTSLFSGIETRYMLPLWVLIYMLVLAPCWPNPIDRHRDGLRRLQTVAILAVAYLVSMAVVWYVVSGAVGRVRV